MIRVLLADDQALVRAGLRMLIESEADLELAGEASDGGQAVELARREMPDVVLMDLSMPEVDGLAATRRIVADPELATVKVVILTTFATDEHVFEALRAGASGFCVKDAEPSELLHAIRVVVSGDALMSPGPTRRLIEEFVSRPELSHAIPTQVEWLTEREREVLMLVAAGLSNGEIATRLVVSPATAKTHVSRAMRKLHAHDRAQLVVIAYETGLVAPGHVTGRAPGNKREPLAAGGL
jgi:DNA-binding NarL/FixJ family response regulator